jgi:hypothetical protein
MILTTGKGLEVEKDCSLSPDEKGILRQQQIELPPFKRCVYYRPFGYSGAIGNDGAAGNRVEGQVFDGLDAFNNFKPSKIRANANPAKRGQFMILEKEEGGYLAMLPMVSQKTLSYFDVDEKGLQLFSENGGTEEVNGDVPLYAWANGASPYEVTRLVWEAAIESGFVYADWRSNKPFPEQYEYVGWCSWEHFKWNINEENMRESIQALEKSPVPFRWVIIDDGYLTHKERQILSFTPDVEKFPNGWKPLTSMKKETDIKWMGLWCNFLGYMRGISPDHTMDDISEYVDGHESVEGLMYQPNGTKAGSQSFYNKMVQNTAENGFDFTKVDFQSRAYDNYIGRPNAVEAMRFNNEALEDACHDYGIELLNCIAQTAINSFQFRYCAVARNSEDYTTSNLDNNLRATYQSFANNLWMGQTCWGDFDEFHTHCPDAELMAKARALSGGPIYTSDEPTKTVPEVLLKFCAEDGQLFRTLAPATLLPDSFFIEPFNGKEVTRAVAPMAGNATAIGLYNLDEDGDALSARVCADDYPRAGELLQPAQQWAMPKEGLLCYDCETQQAEVLTDVYEKNLPAGVGHLLQLHPITNGMAVIGRIDKYLPGAAIESLSSNNDALEVVLKESGPIYIWSADGAPRIDGISSEEVSTSLYRFDFPLGEKKYKLSVVA